MDTVSATRHQARIRIATSCRFWQSCQPKAPVAIKHKTRAVKHHDTTVYFEAEASGLTTVVRDREVKAGHSLHLSQSISNGQHNRNLNELVHLDGVRGAVDRRQARPQPTWTAGLDSDSVDVWPPFGHDVDNAAANSIAAGLGTPTSWTVSGRKGQALCYHDDSGELS